MNDEPRESVAEIVAMAQDAALAENQVNAAYTASRHLEEKMFIFLDAIKDIGKINMWYSRQYIRDEFELSTPEATRVLGRWMRTFTQRQKGATRG